MWHRIIPELQKEYKVITFDYTGAGLSDASAYEESRYAAISGYSMDIVEILDEMNTSNIHFIGHSVSGMIGGRRGCEAPRSLRINNHDRTIRSLFK
ncbi:alpha/beta fold hydrolase [Alkalicoccus saliphilus]|uniref:alpha/beta fold hydrolase n=1 Tax=Alkalicoccus saliphilus TaxID=200989 RepID=UPI001FE429FF|nr:alpha/beta hydrolase [Alkalicoccus saliphilus]